MEFDSDVSRFVYVKKLLRRYHNKNELKTRLILNHIIILYNVFNAEANTRLLFCKVDEEYWSALKTFLLFLNFMPETIYNVNGKNIHSQNISIDLRIVNELRKL